MKPTQPMRRYPLLFVILLIYLIVPILGCTTQTYSSESVCYGTTKKGRLESGVQLPSDGKNFVSYSGIAEMAGRTYVHSKVHKAVIKAYKKLEKVQPSKVYKFAETGFEEGGKFRPHKTHQNGLSIDFMVPVLDQSGKSVHLPTHVFNKFGYKIEFDKKGRYEEYQIDYEALASHIVLLDQVTREQGIGLWRVIFDPKLQPFLLVTKYGGYLKKNILFSKKRSWVRHDEHYHVDFKVKCKTLKEKRKY